MNLNGKVAIITGSSSGIGAETAVQLAAAGCSVTIIGRNEGNLAEVRDQCIKAGLNPNKVLVITADFTKEDDLKNIVDSTIEHFKKLDILINNAGTMINGSIEVLTMEQYDEMMNVNVRSTIILTKYAVPYLLKTKGSILNVSSIAGLKAVSNLLAYCMSKAAMDQMTRCMALDLSPKGVRVNAVNPGVIATGLYRKMSNEQYQKFLEDCRKTHPIGRAGTPEEVAKTILFLVSDSSSFTTGQTIAIDGGRSLMGPI